MAFHKKIILVNELSPSGDRWHNTYFLSTSHSRSGYIKTINTLPNIMINLFTYGSLMCSDIMFRVASCNTDCTQAVLNNFFRSKIKSREYPGIVPQQGALVSGVLYLNLSAEAIRRLDVFEGEMYHRQEVEIVTENHGSAIAMTYVMKPQYRHLLTDKEWNFSEFLAGGKEKFEESYFGFDEL